MESKLEPILNSLVIGVQVLDSQWCWLYVNEVAARQLGEPREDLIGASFLDAFPDGEREELTGLLRRCLCERSSGTVEAAVGRGDGSQRCFEFHVQPLEEGILVTSTDITDRKEIEQELKLARDRAEEREQDIRSIYNTVGNVIFKLSVEPGDQYRFRSINEQFLQVTGLREEDILGKSVHDIIPEPSLSIVLEHYKTAIQERRTVRWEEVSRYPTGELTGEVSIAPNYNTEGECRFLVGAVHDITQRKSDEELLQKKNEELAEARDKAETGEAKIRAFTDQSPMAIYTTDVHGGLVYANTKWLQEAGLSLEAAQGAGWLRAVHPEDRESMRELWKSSVDSKESWSYECRFQDSSGNVTWIDGATNALRDGKGKLIGYTGTNIDITERKLAEKALIENQRVKVIGEMASAIAHDFNNSLQSILGNVEIVLLRGELPGASIKNLENVRSAAMQAAQRASLVQRFSGGPGRKARPTKLNVNSLIEQLLENSKHLWQDELQRDGVPLRIHTQLGDVPPCRGVEGEISAVLLNVLKNSMESMPNGGEIVVRTELHNGGVAITVRDTGIGMDAETRARVFQPFFSTKGFELGRGLGMSGAYGIIQEHGGRISVLATEPGLGTTIEIYLPKMTTEELND